MGDYQNEYELFYNEAINLLDKGGSIANVYEYVDSLPGEDDRYRDHTFMKIARLFASKVRVEDALYFCRAIHDKIDHADALFDVGRELTKHNALDSAKDVLRQAIEAAGAIEPGAWEMPAIFLRVSVELWNLDEQQEALGLLHRAIELAKQPPQPFEAGKTLRGCARLLASWNRLPEAIEVAQAIESPELRAIALEEIQGRGKWPVYPGVRIE